MMDENSLTPPVLTTDQDVSMLLLARTALEEISSNPWALSPYVVAATCSNALAIIDKLEKENRMLRDEKSS